MAFFPEGTRTKPGERLKYKTGAARLACELGLPILPIALNAGRLWPRNAWIKRPGLVTVEVGPPISSAGQTPESLMKAVQIWIDETSDALH
jgi:1-acyl-sn-glycerol-3-phosphate acyltransferase